LGRAPAGEHVHAGKFTCWDDENGVLGQLKGVIHTHRRNRRLNKASRLLCSGNFQRLPGEDGKKQWAAVKDDLLKLEKFYGGDNAVGPERTIGEAAGIEVGQGEGPSVPGPSPVLPEGV
jgi:hypothetical protein